MIDNKLLKHFGFKPTSINRFGAFEMGSYCNDNIGLYYNPSIHTDQQFASNLMEGIANKTKKDIISFVATYNIQKPK